MLTHEGDNLGLKTILALESGSKVADSTVAIASHVRYLADLVEHLATGKQKNTNQTQPSPDIAVLDDGQYVWPNSVADAGDEQGEDDRHDPHDVVNWSAHCWVRSVR